MSELLKTAKNGQWELLSKEDAGKKGMAPELKPSKKDKWMEGTPKAGELMEYANKPSIPVNKAEAGSNPKVITTNKLIKPSEVSDAGPASFKFTAPKKQVASSVRHPMGEKAKKSEEVLKFSPGGQWHLGKDKNNPSATKDMEKNVEMGYDNSKPMQPNSI